MASAISVLTSCLRVHQIELSCVSSTWISINANPPRFLIDTLDASGKPLRIADKATWARVYSVKTRRRGIAQFSANGYLKANAPDVFFFVLVDEGQVWMLRREDLAQLDREVRSVPKGQRSIKEAKSGMAAHGDKPGSMRLWFPRGPAKDLFCLAKRIQETMSIDHNEVTMDNDNTEHLEAEWRSIAPSVVEKLPSTFADFVRAMKQYGQSAGGITAVTHLVDLEQKLLTLEATRTKMKKARSRPRRL